MSNNAHNRLDGLFDDEQPPTGQWSEGELAELDQFYADLGAGKIEFVASEEGVEFVPKDEFDSYGQDNV